MKLNELFPSKYLKAEDLDGDLTVTIKSASLESFTDRDTGKEADKLVVYFNEVDKGLLLNKTNFKSLVELTNEEDSDNWVGQKVTLTVIDVDAFGDVVAAIRIKKTALNRETLVKRYKELVAKATDMGMKLSSDFDIDDKTPVDAIVQAGKQLREMIDGATAI